VVAGAALTIAAALHAQSLAGIYEESPVVRVDEVLPLGLISSGSHRVQDDVRGQGNTLEFTIESDLGTYRVESVAIVALRVREIGTLTQAIDDYQRSNEQLATELRGIMQVGADSWVDILTSPLKTAGTMAGQAATNVGQTFTELGQIAEGEVPGASPGAGRNVYESMIPSDPVLASHKRNVASQLKLDVYSSNSRVQEFLNTLARARGGGNRSAGMTAVTLPANPMRQLAGGRLENDTTTAITRMTITELYRHNERRLASLGVEEPLLGSFLSHPRLSPRHKTLIVEHLVYLDGVAQPQALLAAAIDTRTEEQALAHVQSARMLGLYHEIEAPLRRLISGGHVLLAISRDEALVVVLPFDLIYWDRATEEIFRAVRAYADDARLSGRVLLVAGVATARAREEFRNLGFEVRERYPLAAR
jgi:hypothetical protein